MEKKIFNRKGTKTSNFGTSGRINHDSTEFYDSKLYKNSKDELKEVKYVESQLGVNLINRVYCHSSEKMDELPDNSVHLMVTSPPYNVKKEYDEDLTLEDYRKLIKNVMQETFRVLVPGGRACINVANLGRKPYIPIHSYIIQDMIDIGYLMRGEIIWDKGSSSGTSTAWGSWLSAANPVLRDRHEYILIFSKATFSLQSNGKKSTIEKRDFLDNTLSIWNFSAVSARSIGHPAPFPIELPHRLIQLYSFKNDVILDPFCGSGSTCLAALKNERKYVGYDTVKEYVELTNKRVLKYLNDISQESLNFKK